MVDHRILAETSLVAIPPLGPHKADHLIQVALVRGTILPALGEILEILVLMPGGLEFGYVRQTAGK